MIWAEVVPYVSFQDIWHHEIATFWVHTVVRTCASDQIPVRLDVDFSARVPVAEAAPRHGWHGVALVVHPLELGDLRVEKRCPGRVTDSRGSERSTLDPRLRGEIELQI